VNVIFVPYQFFKIFPLLNPFRYWGTRTAMMTEAQRPKVGVGVIIHDNAGNIVMGTRAGSHGAGNTLNNSPLFCIVTYSS
jgi:hypothetical protein